MILFADDRGVVRHTAVKPSVTVVVPVLNEGVQLVASVRTLLDHLSTLGGFAWSVNIVDNGSTDNTRALADGLAREFDQVLVLSLPQRGRGRALREAWTQSESDLLCYMDCDLSTDLTFLAPLLAPLVERTADVCTGTRLSRREWTRRGWKREMLSRSYNVMLRTVFGRSFPVSDAQCGFKALTKAAARDVLPLIEDNEWFFDTELLLLAHQLNYRVREIPVRWTDDSDTRVRILSTIVQDLLGIARMWRTLRPAVGHSPVHRVRRTGISHGA